MAMLLGKGMVMRGNNIWCRGPRRIGTAAHHPDPFQKGAAFRAGVDRQLHLCLGRSRTRNLADYPLKGDKGAHHSF